MSKFEAAIEAASDYGTVTICQNPEMEEVRRDPMGVKWCFKCRKRCEFHWIVETPATLEGWYFGPTAHTECSGCKGRETDLFPGWYREQPDY